MKLQKQQITLNLSNQSVQRRNDWGNKLDLALIENNKQKIDIKNNLKRIFIDGAVCKN